MGIAYDTQGRLIVADKPPYGGGYIWCVDGAGVHKIAGDPYSAPGYVPGQNFVAGSTPVAARLAQAWLTVTLFNPTFPKAAPDGLIVFSVGTPAGLFRTKPV
jgi:hypothetical protein